MKAVKHSGLVPVTVKQSFGRYREGDTVRLSPNDATRFAEHLTPAKTSAATVDVPQPAAELVSPRVMQHPVPGIPEDWETLHPLQQLKLAEQIAGEKVGRQADARKIIADTLAKQRKG